MRLRSALAAAVGGLLLSVALPSSPAAAANGEFVYTYVGLNGVSLRGALPDPESRVCITIPETVDSALPAFAPGNFTDATATVFLDADCNGDTFYVMPPGRRLGDRLRLRSVVFS
ncbi:MULTISPECIES: hypothetical protein [Streptomyces]|uniref:Uncharacterized protein n=1 Tax=Streptomyces amritsarensis TaxID=681158 RepID=A0ABX3FYF7_9ACTN|nr:MULTISPECIES: hypothetical protein [Streptomyces]AQT75682.1 hypothetical protein B1K54_32325 [Streptomyces sp. fd1-xmd]OLZ62725.1 hypothetical protein AVW11_22090 [Streptomyces amritsarensis]